MENENPFEYARGYNALRFGRWSQTGQYYMFTTVTENRDPLFRDMFVGRIVVKEMICLQQKGMINSIACMLMPDHLHWLFALGGKESLSNVVKLLKGRSARRVNDVLNRSGRVWQRAFYDHALRKDENVRKLARYIVANPIRAGIVKNIWDYPLWDAIWLKNL